ncbi:MULTISPECIES: DUF3952 domain-containing protein [unclassified Bacillus (in: firmicutes)]|uniref:DUF3952 domain-containing protein n=1 Tax=unclassified Bacillus (in: firmicutes) TaxID=185979 RepID=UPI0008DF0C43|nr:MULTISPECIES: DUF3952 domain-containing protein [unclassified Bacillus (in: firmicutes)]SFK13875.1 protein of unknown function [Bacillus sp. 71mf]SFS96884.1 protein of unknown function [Bacillus sp. 103mf]
MKKGVKMSFISVLLGTCLTLTGCKVEYKDIAKALDEGDMKTVMAASDDGYAYVSVGVYRILEYPKVGEKRDEKKKDEERIDQVTEGIFSIRDHSFYGVTSQSKSTYTMHYSGGHISDVTDKKEKNVYTTNISYSNKNIQLSTPNVDASLVTFFFTDLKGLAKVTPEDTRRGMDEPVLVTFKFNKQQFDKIVKPKLHLDYDEFISAELEMKLNSPNKPNEVVDMSLDIKYKKKVQNQLLSFEDSYAVGFAHKQDNDKGGKKEYLDYKNKFNEGRESCPST